MNIKSIKEAGSLKGKRVMVRVDFNVPVQDGRIIDDLRIRVAMPTIEYLKSEGAKVILISHIESIPSLELVAEKMGINLVKDFMNWDGKIEESEVLLFENLRTNPGEKANDPEFTKVLASYADIYVNDAFPVCHREHASVVGVPKLLPHYAGFQLMKEIENLSAFFNPAHPFIFILGGAKFETKLPLIEKFSNTADYIFVGGALMNDVFKAKGYEVGKSLVSEKEMDMKSIVADQRIILPTDVVVQSGRVSNVKDVQKDEIIMDVGPVSIDAFADKIKTAKFILWNGPLGLYEKGFKDQTLKLAKLILESGAKCAVGGGDTVAAIESLKVENPNVFISSGGGAMLQFLEEESLVGIKAQEYSL